MTLAEQNQIIRDAWVRNLQKQGNIPEDLGTIYKNWLKEKIKQAAEQLVEKQPESQQNEQSQQEAS